MMAMTIDRVFLLDKRMSIGVVPEERLVLWNYPLYNNDTGPSPFFDGSELLPVGNDELDAAKGWVWPLFVIPLSLADVSLLNFRI